MKTTSMISWDTLLRLAALIAIFGLIISGKHIFIGQEVAAAQSITISPATLPNTNAAASAGAFNQGRNLHALTLSGAASYIMPVFSPGC